MRGNAALLTLLGLFALGCPSTGDKDTANACPGAGQLDLCDDIDSDCDGEIDEDATETIWYGDEDGDGYGGEYAAVYACAQPDGYYPELLDCDDQDPDVSPDASEVCGGGDEDCDGLVDDTDPDLTDPTRWYLDEDGDGFGAGPSFRFCEQPDGYVDNALDCDDTDDTVLDTLTWYQDEDGDGYGDPTASQTACEQPEGYADNALDCDDAQGAVSPGSVEVCLDDLDNDCDGTDNGCLPYEGSYRFSEAGATVDSTQSSFGLTLRHADTDGDRSVEVIAAAPYGSSYAGTLYLFEGLKPGTSDSESIASMQLVGSSSYGYLGNGGFADGADYDGDGYDDIAAYSSSTTTVVLVNGPIYEDDSVDRFGGLLTGLSGTPQANRRWLMPGDFDEDGDASLLVGCMYCSSSYTYEGAVFLVETPLTGGKLDLGSEATATIWGGTTYGYLGNSLEDLGDTDGDGVHEIAWSSYYYSYGFSYNGLTAVSSSGLSGSYTITDAELLIFGSKDNQYSGFRLVAPGDLDGDGYADLATTAYYDNSFTGSSLGAAYIFLAPLPVGAMSTARADAALYGSVSGELFGQHLVGADLNGDGVGDLVVGDYSADSYTGAAYMFYGPLDSGTRADSEADATISGSSTPSYMSYEMAAVGDVDGDGYDDIAIDDYGASAFGVFFGGAL